MLKHEEDNTGVAESCLKNRGKYGLKRMEKRHTLWNGRGTSWVPYALGSNQPESKRLVGIREKKGAYMSGSEEHSKRDENLHKTASTTWETCSRTSHHTPCLFECDTLHGELVPGLIRLIELFLGPDQTRLVQCEAASAELHREREL